MVCHILQAQQQLRMYKEELAKKERLIEKLTVYDMIVYFLNLMTCVTTENFAFLSINMFSLNKDECHEWCHFKFVCFLCSLGYVDTFRVQIYLFYLFLQPGDSKTKWI